MPFAGETWRVRSVSANECVGELGAGWWAPFSMALFCPGAAAVPALATVGLGDVMVNSGADAATSSCFVRAATSRSSRTRWAADVLF